MRSKFQFILLLAVACTTHAAAQNVSSRKIAWQFDKSFEMHSGVEILRYGTITTDSNISVELSYENNDRFSFSITQIEGQWNDPSQPGSLLYHVTYQDLTGKILIERMPGEKVTILIDFSASVQTAIKQKFSIYNFEQR